MNDAWRRATKFSDDTGQADPVLRALLGDPETYEAQREIVESVRTGRLLIAAVQADVAPCDDHDDHDHDHTHDHEHQPGMDQMATVIVTDAQGRRALLCFTGVDSLARWRSDARPVPVTGVEAAQAALQEDCSALLIDAAGPTRYALAGTGLWALAAGGPWRHPLQEPEITNELNEALAASGLPGRYVVDPSTIDGLALELATEDPAAAGLLARQIGEIPAVRARVSSLEVRLVR